MTTPTFLFKPITAGLFWGILGGLALILITLFTTSGLIQVSPYPFILIAAILVIKNRDTSNKIFSKMVKTGFITFLIMSLVLYLYIVLIINPNSGINFIGHLWRFGIISGIGIVSSLLLSFIAKPVK